MRRLGVSRKHLFSTGLDGGRRHGTGPDHMPSAHRRYADCSPKRFKRWARGFGAETEGLIIASIIEHNTDRHR